MSKYGFKAAAASVAMLLMAASAHAGEGATVEIVVGSASGSPGDTVQVEVTLSTGGNEVAGTQNDITFGADSGIRVAALGNGRPDCTVNPDINKTGTQFAFQPPNCTGDACTGIRAIVINFGDLSPIEDGSLLYTCNVVIDEEAAAGAKLLENTNAGASDPSGAELPTEGIDGTVEVIGEVDATIIIGEATGQPGDTVAIEVSLDTDVDVAGTQNDFSFAEPLRVVALGNGRPDCTVNPDINKTGTQFAFQPPNCTGDACTGVRAIVINFGDLSPIPGGSLLFTCNVAIAEDAEDGTYPLVCSNAGASDPSGGELVTGCTNGAVTVGGETPTPTETPEPTFTPTQGATDTPTRRPTNTPGGGRGNDDDGCAVVAPADSNAAWLLLLPAAALLWLRRRSR